MQSSGGGTAGSDLAIVAAGDRKERDENDKLGNALGDGLAHADWSNSSQQTQVLYTAEEAAQDTAREMGRTGWQAPSPVAYTDEEAQQDFVREANRAVSRTASDAGDSPDNRSLLNADKSSYQQGDFNGRDVTKSGDTLTGLFKKNYGYTPSPTELIQYANYNNLTSAHDVSVNREIISPSLEQLQQVGVGQDQMTAYMARNAQFVAARKAAEFKSVMDSWHALDGTQAERNSDPNYVMALNAQRQPNYGYPALPAAPTYSRTPTLLDQVAEYGYATLVGGPSVILSKVTGNPDYANAAFETAPTASNFLPHGVAYVTGGTIEAGVGPLAAGYQANSAVGLFTGGENNEHIGAFASSGGMTTVPGDKSGNFVIGATAGPSWGGMVTNARSAMEVKGPFDTWTLNLSVASFQVAQGGGIWTFGVAGAPEKALSASLSRYTVTTTNATGKEPQ